MAPPRKRSKIFAEREYVVVESSGRGVTTAGKPYNNPYWEIFRLAGGKVKEVTVYLDTALIDTTFGAGAIGD